MPPESVCLSHRERKKQATRRAIHDAAFELVEQSGFTGVTVEAISERAGVAPRTFWSYFLPRKPRCSTWPPIARGCCDPHCSPGPLTRTL